MSKTWAPVSVLVGVVAIIAGIVFQVTGAAAVVYCSVIGGGILLLVIGGAFWATHVVKDRRQRSRTPAGV